MQFFFFLQNSFLETLTIVLNSGDIIDKVKYITVAVAMQKDSEKQFTDLQAGAQYRVCKICSHRNHLKLFGVVLLHSKFE